MLQVFNKRGAGAIVCHPDNHEGKVKREPPKQLSIEQRKAARMLLLRKIYNMANGSSLNMVKFWEAGKACELPPEVTEDTARFLVDEGYLKYKSMDLGGLITSKGIKRVEEADASPDRGNEHFSSQNSVSVTIGQMNNYNSQVQVGNVEATMNVGADFAGLLALMDEIRSAIPKLNLDASRADDLKNHVETAEALAKTTKPNRGFIRLSLESIQRVLEGSSANVLASGLLAKFPEILNQLAP